jgi:hypothetical protein
MKTKAQIEAQVEATFKALDAIKEVKVDPFFTNKVLRRIKVKEQNKAVFNLRGPQLQLATFGLVLLLNISAIIYAYATPQIAAASDIETFAQEYSLQSETTITLN